MAELKTKPSKASVTVFLDAIPDEDRRRDCKAIARIMKKATGASPVMWGDSIVGFGSYRYKYESGRQGEWFLTGFSPRKQNLTLYIMAGFDGYPALMKKLGKHTTGRACLYIKRLDDTDVLTELIERSVAHMRERRPGM
ncbi:MAG: DUF1801 domain-containing protein [Gemmatimonadetes bacterium]|nr:DUF1801 domain-containing protein [Gemmatimonadota bacterium]